MKVGPMVCSNFCIKLDKSASITPERIPRPYNVFYHGQMKQTKKKRGFSAACPHCRNPFKNFEGRGIGGNILHAQTALGAKFEPTIVASCAKMASTERALRKRTAEAAISAAVADFCYSRSSDDSNDVDS